MAPSNQVVSVSAFRAAKEELLKQEKRATRLLEELAAQRRDLPRVEISNPHEFKFTAPDGKLVSLPDAFKGRRQLILYHMMPTVSKEEGTLSCPGCSFTLDHIPHKDKLRHLHNRNTTFIAAAPVPTNVVSKTIERMGWTFPLYSSKGLFDHADAAHQDVSWRPTEGAFALEVFLKDDNGTVYHTYETYNRGVECLLGTYALLDLTVLGRQDQEHPTRLHDEY